jgi:hypothetical protein
LSAYIIYWTKDRIGAYLANGDEGPLSVIFGGPHQSQPSLGKIKAGDTIYPITVVKGKMYIIASMEVDKIIPEEELLEKPGGEVVMWDSFSKSNMGKITHKVPWSCVDTVAIGKNGTKLKMIELPMEKALLLSLGPEGKQTPLKIKDGLIKTSNLIGYFRRLRELSENTLKELVKE